MVRGVDAEVTVAVAVTKVPRPMVATGFPDELRVRVVAVGLAGAITVTCKGAVAASEPEVPVMVTVPVTGVAVGPAVSVSVLVVDEGLVAMDAVTPAGRPVAA